MKKLILLATVSIFALTAQNAFSASHVTKDEMMKKVEMMKEEAMKKDAMDKEAMMKKEAMKKDAMMKEEAMKKDAMMKEEAMKKDAMMKEEAMKKDAMMTSDYMVKSGDSLWTIAKHAYGSGSMYMKIKAANEGISNDLEIGQMIKLPK